MAREIPLSRGLVAIVDDDDFQWLSQWKWYALRVRTREYAVRNATKAEREAGRPATIGMHRELCASDLLVDHADRNTLNNRRANLRPANHQQNGANSDRARGRTGYRGVVRERNGDFRAEIAPGGARLYLGRYRDPAEAARAYDAAALAHFGEFAVLNFPLEAA